MNDTDKPDPVEQLKAPAVQEHDPNKPTFVLVPPALMGAVIKRLGKQPANKVHGLLNQLNGCQTAQIDLPDK